MAVRDVIELTRLKFQDELDSAKTQAERNKLGQFATPTDLATDILNYAKLLVPSRSKVRFLDPAIGTGSFYSALLRTFPPSRITEAVGYEIDPHYGEKAIKLWENTDLKLHLADFTQAIQQNSDRKKANLLICNPPYVRHHHLTSDDKKRLQWRAKQICGVKLSGLAGLYCYFLCLSHEWLAEDGLAGWLIPSEFMGVNYGKQIKQYLLNRVMLLRIHRFDPNDVQFDNALVSSAVVWYRKKKPPGNHTVEFSYGGTLSRPESSGLVPSEVLHTENKWTKFPSSTNILHRNRHEIKLSALFKIKRGLATGANKFFILTSEQVSTHKLPTKFLKPILPSPRHLSEDEIEADRLGRPLLDRKLFLLSCNLSEKKVEIEYPSLWKYLETGIETGISERYLCKHRSPWYTQEHRPASPFLCTYMGRFGTKAKRPFRFILNHSKATAPNVYLMLYPKPVLQMVMNEDSKLIRLIWQALNKIPMENLVDEGRVYGGGLHKIEPNELANVSAENILAVLPKLNISPSEQMALFSEKV